MFMQTSPTLPREVGGVPGEAGGGGEGLTLPAKSGEYPAKPGEYPAKPGEEPSLPREVGGVPGEAGGGGSLRFLLGRSVAVEGVPAPGYHVVQLEPEDPVAFQRLADDLDPRFELRLNNGVGTCFLEAPDLGRVRGAGQDVHPGIEMPGVAHSDLHRCPMRHQRRHEASLVEPDVGEDGDVAGVAVDRRHT